LSTSSSFDISNWDPLAEEAKGEFGGSYKHHSATSWIGTAIAPPMINHLCFSQKLLFSRASRMARLRRIKDPILNRAGYGDVCGEGSEDVEDGDVIESGRAP